VRAKYATYDCLVSCLSSDKLQIVLAMGGVCHRPLKYDECQVSAFRPLLELMSVSVTQPLAMTTVILLVSETLIT